MAKKQTKTLEQGLNARKKELTERYSEELTDLMCRIFRHIDPETYFLFVDETDGNRVAFSKYSSMPILSLSWCDEEGTATIMADEIGDLNIIEKEKS